MIIQQTFLKAMQAAGVSTFTSLGSVGTGNFSNDVLNFSPNRTVNAGTLLVILYTQSASNTTAPTVTDTKGNTWQSGGSNGYHCIFFSKLSSALTTSDQIHFTGASTLSRAVSAWNFDIPTGMNVYRDSYVTAGSGYFNATPSMSLSGLTNRTYLFLRGIGLYNAGYTVGSITPTTGYAAFTNSQYVSANATDYVFVRGEWVISTGTGTTSNPGDGFNDTPSVDVLAALYLAP